MKLNNSEFYQEFRGMHVTFRKIKIVATIALISGASHAHNLYGIQLGAFERQSDAETLSRKLDGLTSGVAVNITNDSPFRFKVVTGPFLSYMDAWAYKTSKINTLGSFNAPIVKWSTELTSSELSNPIKSVYPVSSIGTEIPTQKDQPNPKRFVEILAPGLITDNIYKVSERPIADQQSEELLSSGFYGKKNSDAADALRLFLQKNPDHIAVPSVKIRLARRILAQKKSEEAQALLIDVIKTANREERDKAKMVLAYTMNSLKGQRTGYNEFLKLAQDNELSGDYRSHALRMAAGNAHAIKEMTSAVLAFRQLEAEAPSTAERYEASLQLCGLQYELVGRAKGSWNEVVASCDKLLNDPEAPHEIKATAGLMRFEALFHDNRIDEAIAACEDYLENFGDVKREYITATTWYGALLLHADRQSEAKRAFESVLDIELESKEKFGGREPKARAAYWLAFIALQQNDLAARDRYIEYIKSNFSDSEEASKLSSLTGQVKN